MESRTQTQTGERFREAPFDQEDETFEEIQHDHAFDLLEFKRFVRTTSAADCEVFLSDLASLLRKEFLRVVRTRRSVRVGICGM